MCWCCWHASLTDAVWNWPRTIEGIKWILSRKGICASNHFDAVSCVRSSPEIDYPDLQLCLSPIAVDNINWEPIPEHAFQIHIGLMRAHSRGGIKLCDANPDTPPSILVNYLQDKRDREAIQNGVRIVRELVDQPAFSELCGDEIFPGNDVQTNEALNAYINEHTVSQWHLSCTAKMGAETGTPEANLVTMALSQLGNRLGVPVRSGTGGQITAANTPDGQAMQDSANGMWATMLSGGHQVWHAAGWLEGGLTMSYEKFVMDLDNCGAMLKMFQGMTVDEAAFSKESYSEAGPGQNFLSTSHTMQNFASANYESLLPDAGSYEMWSENGSKTAAERANSRWKEMLEAYEEPGLDEAIDRELQAFVNEQKASMPDEWY